MKKKNRIQMLMLILFTLLFLNNLNNAECLKKRNILFKRSTTSSQTATTTTLVTAPALMLTTFDTISLIYPKEMGYEKDFLHVIYKIQNSNFNNNNNSYLRIEDSIYDNKTWSIYCLISNSSGGSEIIRLRHMVPFNRRESLLKRKSSSSSSSSSLLSTKLESNQFYQIASNWSRLIIYKNSTTKILSLDINVKKRKLYWLEFNILSQKWSMAIKKLNHDLSLPIFNTFQFNSNFFSSDGYSFITVAQDYSDEIVLFISNNQTLNICYLSNMTCDDYFRSLKPFSSASSSVSSVIIQKQTTRKSNDENYDEYNLIEDVNDDYELNDKNQTDLLLHTSTSTTTTTELPPLYKFGRLMGIKYDSKEHSLYLDDYGNDRIEKITFIANTFEFSNIETILKSDSMQSPINPIMSVFYDSSYIFWIDFEEGLKTTVFKSSCIRTIYKAKEATNLRFIQIGTYKTTTKTQNRKQQSIEQQLLSNNYDSSSANVINRLISLQEANNEFQYPPDYDNYLSNEETISDQRKLKFRLALKSRANKLFIYYNISFILFLQFLTLEYFFL